LPVVVDWATLIRFKQIEVAVNEDPLNAYQAVAAAVDRVSTPVAQRIGKRTGDMRCPNIVNSDTHDQIIARLVKQHLTSASDGPAATASTAPVPAPGSSKSSDTPDCHPCSTQEDFDVAWSKRKKCCPVRGCEGDSDCSGGRVCCRIPMGTLCTDSKRCGARDRVP
jgi:hypothetical protein